MALRLFVDCIFNLLPPPPPPSSLFVHACFTAKLTNFLIYYREHLRGVPVEEVERRRVAREKARAAEEAKAEEAAEAEEA